MKFLPVAAASLALLTACTAPSPEERAARSASEAQLAQTISSRMLAPATVAMAECFRQVETGSFSEAALLNAGFQKGSFLGAGAYYVTVTDKIKQGLFERELTFGINIGAAASVNFGSGCKLMLPNQGDADIPLIAAGISAAATNGYTTTINRRGSLTVQKGDAKILTTVQRTIGSGVDAVGGFVRATK